MTNSSQVNYKTTLNLPKTNFPMKANLAQNEPASIKRWQKMNLYEKVTSEPAQEEFAFHDGPPYANGSIHIGHLLNKVLKDMVVRSRNMAGQRCRFIPGWDCHGLPIEHKVVAELLQAKPQLFKEQDADTLRKIIRAECQKYASKYIKLQSQQMQRLLTLADYDHPYLTMTPEYEKAVLNVFAMLVEEGIVYRQLKPVHWSIANQTALADAELEYKDRNDISVFVHFNITDSDRVFDVFGRTVDDGVVSLMIWTTTPWTLPANLAVAVHESFSYVLVKSAKGYSIIAKELVQKVAKTTGLSFEILGETTGAELLGIRYRHPFCKRGGKVASGDFVTLEDGSGLVHIAPGHGVEDYQVGLREGLDIYCPVQADGTYDATVPEWLTGLSVWEANGKIVEHIRNSGHLVHDEVFSHSYPHDWRSKTPVIFRSTEQWFISVDNPLKNHSKSLRELALETVSNDVRFVPDWGKNRLRGMLEARPDWCLSRQRAWGLPIPAFRRPDGKVLLTPASIRAVGRCFEDEGSDAWFKKTPAELLADYDLAEDPDAPKDTDVNTLEKMYDIFDVWFESGTSWHAVLQNREIGFPADLYLEGSDQHRGWFHLSLLPALGATQHAPYKSVVTHGFIVDKDGYKMSKSVGNTIEVEELLQKHGAEVARWWVSSLAYENDIKVDWAYFDVAGESYRKIRNTLRYLLSTISDLDPKPANVNDVLSKLKTMADDPGWAVTPEAYVLQKLTELQRDVTEAYANYKFKQANTALYQFCNDTLSSFYLMAMKDRLYCDRKTSPRRLRAQYAMWLITEVLCRLLAPILPHTSDEAYQSLYDNPALTIHTQRLFKVEFHCDPRWKDLIGIRSAVLKRLEEEKSNGIENTLDAGINLMDPTKGELESFIPDMADIFGVSQVFLVPVAMQQPLAEIPALISKGQGIKVNDLRDQQPRCERSWKRDGTVKPRPDGGMLSDRDWEAVQAAKGEA